MFRSPIQLPNIDDISSTISSTFNTSITSITTCLSNCYARFFHAKPNQRLLAEQHITQRLKACISLIESQDNDMHTIRMALTNTHEDLHTSYRNINIFLTSSSSLSLIQESSETFDKSLENRVSMLHNLSALLDTYPKLEPEDENSVYQLDIFYKERLEHHQQVLQLLETYLPETYAALKEVETTIKNTSKF